VLKDESGDLTVAAIPMRCNGSGARSTNNWSLSAGRAEATRQELMRDGLLENRFRKIEGVADREPLIEDNPTDARNRRMSILLAT
jgi:chemotaxis protein MotB